MKRFGILTAMEQELACLENAGIVSDDSCAVSMTGIGKVNAAATAVEMILRYGPEFIVNTGVAGGMLPDMRPMDIVVGENVAYHDVWCGNENAPGQVQGQPRFFPADSALLRTARFAAEGMNRVRFGLIASGDQFFVSLDEDRRIRNLYPEILACDMESAAIAQVCRRYGVPFLCIRYISDVHTSAEIQKKNYSEFLDEYRLRGFDFIRRFIEKILLEFESSQL